MYGRRFIAGSVALLVVPLALTAAQTPAWADEPAPPAAAADPSPAAAPAKEGFQLELGLLGGVHFFSSKLELGVPDALTSPHPKTGAEFGLRAAAVFLPWLSLEGEAAATIEPLRPAAKK